MENVESAPKVALVMRSFLDYRVPVFAELDELLNGRLWLLYSLDHTPGRVQSKISRALGSRAIGLSGEFSLGDKGNVTSEMANRAWRVPYQPGIFARLKAIQPDVVVGDGFFQWTWQALVYHLVSNTPLAITYERTAHTERNAQWYRRAFRKVVLRFISAMAVNGRLSKEYVESLGVDSENIVVGQMVADTGGLSERVARVPEATRREWRRRFVTDTHGKIYMTVGQLIARKGVEELLAGWEVYQGKANCGDALVIIGDGPQKETLEALCKTKAIPGVHFLGPVDYDEIDQYYASADWFISSTLEDNWSLVVPEAMACGLPILCSKYNGCWPELVHDGVNGWVFDPLQSCDIDRVLQLASKTSGYEEMSRSSRRLVAAQSPAHAAKSIFDACNRAIAN